MIKNIVFDLGGVVVDYDPREFLVDRFMNEKLENRLYDITFGSAEWLKLDAGMITRAEAEGIMQRKGEKIGHKFEIDVVLNDWMDMLKNKEDTISLMRKLHKNGYRLYYLSNIAEDTLVHLAKRSFWVLFDGGIASCEESILKPDVKIYEKLLRKFAMQPQETIFIDDRQANIITASDLGIVGIRYKNMRELVKALTSYDVKIKTPKKQSVLRRE